MAATNFIKINFFQMNGTRDQITNAVKERHKATLLAIDLKKGGLKPMGEYG